MELFTYYLRDICEVKSGKRLPENSDFSQVETEHKYIRARDIKGGKISDKDLAFISKETQQKIKRYIIEEGDVALTIVANIGDVGYCNANLNGANLTENAVRLTKFDKEKVNAKFLNYYLSQPSLKTYMENLAAGAAQAKLGIYKINKIKISIPNVDIQNKIAKILDDYCNLIDNNEKQIKILEEMAEKLYKEWFVHFRFPGYRKTLIDNVPKYWQKCRLLDLGIELQSGSRPKGGIDSSLTEGIPSLGAECINGLGEFDFSNVKLIDKNFFCKMKRGVLKDKNLLIYKDGAYIGRTTIFMENFPFKKAAINEHVFMCTPKNMNYFYYLYLTLHQREYFRLMQNLNRNAAQPGLSQPDIERINIVKPTEEILIKFNKIIEPIFKEIFMIAKLNLNLAKQRDLLLPRLMSGKLEIN